MDAIAAQRQEMGCVDIGAVVFHGEPVCLGMLRIWWREEANSQPCAAYWYRKFLGNSERTSKSFCQFWGKPF
jgi:hypothetical protein